MKHSCKARLGFILPAALLLLVISCAALALAAYNGGRTALIVNQRELELKRHWTAKALETLLLPAADEILEANSSVSTESIDSDKPVLAYYYGQYRQNGLVFNWILRDEQAMANINSLIATRDALGVSEAYRRLVVADTQQEKPVELLTPLENAEIKTFGEFLDYSDDPERLFKVQKELKGNILRLGCWGDGKLNLLRADRKTLETVLAGSMDLHTIVTLLDVRKQLAFENNDHVENLDDEDNNKGNKITLTELLKILELDDKQREKLSKLACVNSNAFSLTIENSRKTGKWRRMYVYQASESGSAGDNENDKANMDKLVYQW